MSLESGGVDSKFLPSMMARERTPPCGLMPLGLRLLSTANQNEWLWSRDQLSNYQPITAHLSVAPGLSGGNRKVLDLEGARLWA